MADSSRKRPLGVRVALLLGTAVGALAGSLGTAALFTAVVTHVPDVAQPERDASGELESGFTEPDPVARALLRPETPGEVEALRRELIDVLWAGRGLPVDALPSSVEPDRSIVPDAVRGEVIGERLVIALPHGLDSTAWSLRPRGGGSGVLVVYHHGHTLSEDDFIVRLLREGHEVAVLRMPLLHDNPTPQVELANIGPVVLKRHDQLSWLDEPWRPFLEPVIVTINHVLSERPETRVAMTGVSGGGWTTAMASAADPRIEQSFPVAGSLPLHLRRAVDWSDWEQYASELYSRVNFLELYVLGAHPAGREQHQMHSDRDPCCYGAPACRPYAAEVKATLARVSGGTYRCHVDPLFGHHAISPSQQELILSRLRELAD